MKLKVSDLKGMEKKDLLKKLGELKSELSIFATEVKLGKEKNVKKGLLIRKNIARIQTVLSQLA